MEFLSGFVSLEWLALALLKVHVIVVGDLQTNCYVLQSGDRVLVVDVGGEPERIVRFIKDIKAKPINIVATHGHFDHVLGVDVVRKAFGVRFLIHPDDVPILESMQSRVRQFMGYEVPPPPKVDGYITEEETIMVGEEKVRVLHTPGHSPGSISLVCDGSVLTGDALFNQSIGRTDTPGGDLKTLIRSIKTKLFQLDDETLVYPGHGPETTIGDEKLTNPFVGKNSRFN